MGFTTAAALVHELMEARDDRRLLNLQRQLARLNLLIIDELGFVPLSTTGAELLFEVFSQRYERGSILVTTNLPFDSPVVRFAAALDTPGGVCCCPGGRWRVLSRARGLVLFQVSAQSLGPGMMPHLAYGLGLDLADTFPG